MRRGMLWLAAILSLAVGGLTLMASPCGRVSAQPNEDFTTFTIDEVGEGATGTSLMVNLGGRPSISYQSALSHTLKLAQLGFNGAFTTAPVTDTVGFGPWSSLALASSQYPRISFYDETNHDLMLASLVDNAWRVERVDSVGDVGSHTSAATDTGDFVHIVYDDTTNGTIKYARQGATGWLTETIGAGTTADIAVDLGGTPHVSYYDAATKRLRYATRAAGAWTTETVDASGDSGRFNAIALDTVGRPHIAFYEGVGKDLLLASKGPATWTTENVDTIGDVGEYVDLFIDDLNRRLVSYQDMTTGFVKYGVSTSVGIWGLTPLDNTGGIPAYTSIGYRGTHRVHVSYYAKTVDGATVLRMVGQAYPTPTPTLPPTETPSTPGTATPTPTGTFTPGPGTPSITPGPSPTGTETPGPGTPSVTPGPSPTATETPGPGTPSVTPGSSPTFTETPGPGTPSVTPGPSPTASETPGPGTPSVTPGPSPTPTETPGPGTPSVTPGPSPTATVTLGPGTPSATPRPGTGTPGPSATPRDRFTLFLPSTFSAQSHR